MLQLPTQGLLVISLAALVALSTSELKAIAQTADPSATDSSVNQPMNLTTACQEKTWLLTECKTFPIPNETDRPQPGPQSTNPIESQLLSMTSPEDLQRELDSVRFNYQKWQGDRMAMRTQTRLAQIIHALADRLGLTLH